MLGMYLARRRKWLIMLLGLVAFFVLCFYLYHLPLRAVLYPCTLAFFVIVLMFIDDYRRLRKRCDDLLNLDTRYSPLPEALNESEDGRMDKRATGLGLYLCARIAKNLGITLTVESTVGQGTKIYLHFNQRDHMIEENKWLYGEQS